MDVLDEHDNTAISLTVVEENGARVMFALRLKIKRMLITAVETMIVRNRVEGMIFNPAAWLEASAAMVSVPVPGMHNTREDMVNIASLYPARLKSGSFVAVDVPFAANA